MNKLAPQIALTADNLEIALVSAKFGKIGGSQLEFGPFVR